VVVVVIVVVAVVVIVVVVEAAVVVVVVVALVVIIVVVVSYRRFGTTYRSHLQRLLSRNFGKKIATTFCVMAQKSAVLKR